MNCKKKKTAGNFYALFWSRKSGRLLWTLQWTFCYSKMGGISWLTEELLDYQAGLCFIELVNHYGVPSSPCYSTVSNIVYYGASFIIHIAAALLGWLSESFYYSPFVSVAATLLFVILWNALSKKVVKLDKFLRLCFRVTEVNQPSDWNKHQRRGWVQFTTYTIYIYCMGFLKSCYSSS
jgi:hypothetical protein